MNHSRYLSDSRRSPYPRRRRALVPRSPGLGRSLPAITLLSPDGYHLQQTMTPRPLSPGAFRIAPPRSAKQKMTSFVILNDTICSPVTSRAPSPSGRVSPFRGHGFKSPTSSRPTSRAVSPLPSPTRRKGIIVPSEKSKLVHKDIGLPPKSPKRVVKSVQIKEFKPLLKPKPVLPNKGSSPKPAGNITPKVKVVSNKKPMVMSTVDKNKDKKPPVPPKNTSTVTSLQDKTVLSNSSKQVEATEKSESKESDASTEAPPPLAKEETQVTEIKKEERLIPCFQPDKCCVVPPTMASPTQTATSTTAVPSTMTATSTSRGSASRLGAISSAVSVTDALSKGSLRPKPLERPVTPRSPHLDDTKTKLSGTSPAKVESALVTMTTVDEVIKSRIGSAASRKSASSPTLSEKTRSSMVTVRAVSNGSLRDSHGVTLSVAAIGDPGDVISTTKLIRADPDVEVLSPNNLLRSPPHAMREPILQAGQEGAGGSGGAASKGRCRRFGFALWRLLTFIFCCCKRCVCCPRGLPCRRGDSGESCCPPSSCCGRSARGWEGGCPCKSCNPCSFLKSCFSKLNCCKNLQCSSCCKSAACCRRPCGSCSQCCGKVKCCEGKPCCRKKPKPKPKAKASSSCCAKPKCCSCKEMCTSLGQCCGACGERVRRGCRALFCLNLACCQRCLKKCSCCHKLSCCKKGGCCSCCNPHVKPTPNTRLDKKNSRASNQSNQERAKLDAALVDHASMMKAAIPVLPACLAWLCLFLNLFIPGSGTVISGLLCLCFGKPRFSVNDTPQNRLSAFLVDLVIGVAQAFTIIFCLVGWGWSIWWGVIMVKLSRKQKRLKLAEKNEEGAAGGTSTTANQNHVDPERIRQN